MRIPDGASTEIEYPSSDGQPMAENQWQLDAMIDAINVLGTARRVLREYGVDVREVEEGIDRGATRGDLPQALVHQPVEPLVLVAVHAAPERALTHP